MTNELGVVFGEFGVDVTEVLIKGSNGGMACDEHQAALGLKGWVLLTELAV